MPPLQRRVSIRGPRLYIENGELMYINVLDGSTREGPRPATEEDKFACGYAEDRPEPDPLRPMITAVDPDTAAPEPSRKAAK